MASLLFFLKKDLRSYRPNSNFAVWDGMFCPNSSCIRVRDTVLNAFFLIGTVCLSAFDDCNPLFYTVPKSIFEVGTV